MQQSKRNHTESAPAAAAREIRLIAFDLDGTLLNSQKELPPANAAALKRAAEAGALIVPSTGRLFHVMPEEVKNLPFLSYAILSNGAQVYDIAAGETIARSEIPHARALEIMRFLDTLPVVYDCFYDGGAYMTKSAQDRIEEFMPDPQYQRMVKEKRAPVPELKAWLADRGGNVQKIQFFIPDTDLRDRLMEELAVRFPDASVSSAVPNNVEINAADARKGIALQKLADHLHIDMTQTAAFGDGLNDLSIIEMAGIGIAMANSHPKVLAAADLTAPSCDEDGVAVVLAQLGF